MLKSVTHKGTAPQHYATRSCRRQMPTEFKVYDRLNSCIKRDQRPNQRRRALNIYTHNWAVLINFQPITIATAY